MSFRNSDFRDSILNHFKRLIHLGALWALFFTPQSPWAFESCGIGFRTHENQSEASPYNRDQSIIQSDARRLLQDLKAREEKLGSPNFVGTRRVGLGLFSTEPLGLNKYLGHNRSEIVEEAEYRKRVLLELGNLSQDDIERVVIASYGALMNSTMANAGLLTDHLRFLRLSIGGAVATKGRQRAFLAAIEAVFDEGTGNLSDRTSETDHFTLLIIGEMKRIRERVHGSKNNLEDIQSLLTELGHWQNLARERRNAVRTLHRILADSIEETQLELAEQIRKERQSFRPERKS